LVEAQIDVVWYFGGAWYDLRQINKAANVIPLSQLLPYLFQALIPKRLWIWLLNQCHLSPIITMTPFTSEKLVESGYPRSSVKAIYPGKDAVVGTDLGVCSPVVHPCGLDVARLSKRRYFLFFGPPAAIRGIYCILDAFRLISVRYPDAALVCLFRGDTNAAGNRTSIMRAIEEAGAGERIMACWASASPPELDWFLQHAFAVLKPFIIVPSEIPLAVIESAQYGKPVIGFRGDGTGRYIEEIGLAVPRMDVKALAQAMERLLSDQDVYRSRCAAASATYAGHPTWSEVAQQWLHVGMAIRS
jgi:glycosyltransferase involved in cell wall biosynthesis